MPAITLADIGNCDGHRPDYKVLNIIGTKLTRNVKLFKMILPYLKFSESSASGSRIILKNLPEYKYAF